MNQRWVLGLAGVLVTSAIIGAVSVVFGLVGKVESMGVNVENSRSQLQAEITALRRETQADSAAVRREFQADGATLRREINSLQGQSSVHGEAVARLEERIKCAAGN